MKKLLTLILALLMLTASACGDQPSTGDDTKSPSESTENNDTTDDNPSDTTDESDESKPADTTEKSEPKQITTYDCKLDCGVTVTVGSKADTTIAAIEKKLGKHIDFMSAPSCVHDGDDKVYTYDGFTVTSSPDGKGGELITDLSFTSDAVGFENGVMIGSSSDDVTKAFGKDFTESFGVRKYVDGSVTLTFTIDSGAVSAMSVSCAIG